MAQPVSACLDELHGLLSGRAADPVALLGRLQTTLASVEPRSASSSRCTTLLCASRSPPDLLRFVESTLKHHSKDDKLFVGAHRPTAAVPSWAGEVPADRDFVIASRLRLTNNGKLTAESLRGLRRALEGADLRHYVAR